MDGATVRDDLGEAYDLVEQLWTEGQPPSPDWSKVNTLAARLAELAAKLDARSVARVSAAASASNE